MDSFTGAFADRIDHEVLQFETNAGLWRLEIDRLAFRLRENQAVGLSDVLTTEAAQVALEGVKFEIDRLQAFARTHAGLPDATVLRLVEAGLSLETARRRLQRVLQSEN